MEWSASGTVTRSILLIAVVVSDTLKWDFKEVLIIIDHVDLFR